MNILMQYITGLYSRLLLLYPSRFRDEFAEEMQTVFKDSVNGTVEDGILSLVIACLRELGGLPFNILREFWYEFERKETNMIANENVDSKSSGEKQTKRWDALIAALPFILFGVASMLGKFQLSLLAFLAFYFIVLAGLLIGLIKGVPRWTYSYLGWSLVFAWWWMGMPLGTFMQSYSRELLGWRSLLPFLIAIVVALLWTRSLNPLCQLGKDIWQDWTLVSLGLYTFGGFIFLIFDENHHPYLIAFMVAVTFVIAGSIWAYMKSANTGKRVISLLSGFVVSYIIVRICDATWDSAAYYGFRPSSPEQWYIEVYRAVLVIAFWAVLMFWPVLIGLIRYIVNNRQKPGMAA
jgi:hypothetical protein